MVRCRSYGASLSAKRLNLVYRPAEQGHATHGGRRERCESLSTARPLMTRQRRSTYKLAPVRSILLIAPELLIERFFWPQAVKRFLLARPVPLAEPPARTSPVQTCYGNTVSCFAPGSSQVHSLCDCRLWRMTRSQFVNTKAPVDTIASEAAGNVAIVLAATAERQLCATSCSLRVVMRCRAARAGTRARARQSVTTLSPRRRHGRLLPASGA